MTNFLYGASLYGSQPYGPATVPPPTIDAPTYTVEISFLSGTAGTFQLDISQLDVGTLGAPFATTSFQAIDGVLDISIVRGRQDELTTVQAGYADVTFDNRDGSLSPGNPASPYAPNVLPMRRMRISATWQGVTYWLFYGFIESYTPVPLSPADASMAIHAVDAFSILNPQPFTASVAAGDDGTWVAAVLATLNTASLPRAIDAGSVAFVAYTGVNNENALQVLLDAATSANGLFLAAPDGTLVWQTRYHRTTATRSNTVQGTFGQPGADGRYASGVQPFTPDYDYSMDNRLLYTAVTVTSGDPAEGTQRADDTPAQDLYFLRMLGPINARFLAGGQALGMAQSLLNGYKAPQARLRAITVDGDADTDGTLWAQVLGREISDRIHVQLDLPGQVGLDSDMFVEAIQHKISKETGHQVTWQLSATSTIGNPFILDTSTLDSGQLG